MSALSQRTGITVPGAPAVLRSVLDRGIVRGKLCIAECWNASLVCYFCPNCLPNVEKISSGRYRDAKHTMLVAVHFGAGTALAMAVCYHRLSQVVTPYTE